MTHLERDFVFLSHNFLKMSKCKKCGEWVKFMEYYCSKCRKVLAGTKPLKSQDLCAGCRQNWYNHNKERGCWGYKGSKVVIKDVHHDIHSIIPNPKWKLTCFTKQY